MGDNRVERDIRLTTPEGAELSTDVHHPSGDGPFSTVMQRTCYGEALLSDHLGVARNTGSEESLAGAQTLVVAHHQLHHDPARPSSLTLLVLT